MTKVEILDMDEERKKRWKAASDDIIDLCRLKYGFTPFESAGLLKFLLDSLKATYGIEDTLMLQDGSDMKQ